MISPPDCRIRATAAGYRGAFGREQPQGRQKRPDTGRSKKAPTRRFRGEVVHGRHETSPNGSATPTQRASFTHIQRVRWWSMRLSTKPVIRGFTRFLLM